MDINPKELARPYVAKQKDVSSENPHLRSIDRGPYELGRLLQMLPKKYQPLTEDTYQVAKAAYHHIDNNLNTLILGLDAIGSILSIAHMSDEYPVDKRKISALGELMQYMSVEMEFLREMEDHTACAIRQHEGTKVAACTCANEKGGV